jgi:hypothetical protein
MGLWQVPAVVLALLAWLQSPPTSLADAARREALRREAAGPSARRFTDADLPPAEIIANRLPGVSMPPVTETEPPPVVKPPPPPPVEKHDEAWWSKRMADARTALARDRLLVDAMQNRVDALLTDWTNRDDPAQKAKLFEARQVALAELDRLKKDIVADTQAIEAIQEDARKQGVPAGWIR